MTGGLPEKHVVTCFLECGNQILILRRSQMVGSFRGRWAGVSGYVDTTADEQSLIEIQEETSLRPEDVELVSKGETLEAVDEGIRWVVHPYLFRIKEKSKVRIDWEHCETRWIQPEDIDDYQTVPMLKETLSQVYRW
ncbi:MAG: NUDIX domain-containing protein [Dehalococcoidales bacterium]|nr:NUDIX domain-containing protein [Dehalococcoidales bacterium]